jgi:hypothetical protein
MNILKNRIIAHREVPASTLRPHPLNPRTHPEGQRTALRALLEEIGLARSVLAYVADEHKHLPDPPLTLIDGHLRRDTLDDTPITVELLDVTDAEARALLLSIDPLASLANYDAATLNRLRASSSTSSDALANLWNSLAEEDAQAIKTATRPQPNSSKSPVFQERYVVLIHCDDEQHQVALFQRLKKEGLSCELKTA